MVKYFLFLIFFISIASGATIVVDETNPEYYEANDQSYFFYYDQKKLEGYQEFLVTTASGKSVTINGYNDGNETFNPADNGYIVEEKKVTLSNLGVTTYGGVEYVAFYLDANQIGNSYYELKELEIYSNSTGEFNSIEEVRSGSLAFLLDDPVDLYYGQGTANWDIALYVPKNNFAVYGDADLTYITMYVEYNDTAGFDQWGYDVNIIPELTTPLLLSFGVITLVMRRAR